MKAKTIRMTTTCLFCGLSYTFRSEEKFAEYKLKALRFTPTALHPGCKKAEAKKYRGKFS